MTCSRKVVISPDTCLASVKDKSFDVVILPGGLGGAEALAKSSEVGDILRKQEKDGKSLAGKDESGCCSDEVLKFQSLDKNLNQTTNNIVNAQVFVAMLSSFLGVDLITITKKVPPKFKARFYYPRSVDILLATQRFQI